MIWLLTISPIIPAKTVRTNVNNSIENARHWFLDTRLLLLRRLWKVPVLSIIMTGIAKLKITAIIIPGRTSRINPRIIRSPLIIPVDMSEGAFEATVSSVEVRLGDLFSNRSERYLMVRASGIVSIIQPIRMKIEIMGIAKVK